MSCAWADALEGIPGVYRANDAKGNDIADAYHAALAIEWNCVWVTTDKGFKRFKGLKARHPLTLMDA